MTKNLTVKTTSSTMHVVISMAAVGAVYKKTTFFLCAAHGLEATKVATLFRIKQGRRQCDVCKAIAGGAK